MKNFQVGKLTLDPRDLAILKGGAKAVSRDDVAIPTLIAAVEQINSQGLLSRPSLVVTMSIVHAKR